MDAKLENGLGPKSVFSELYLIYHSYFSPASYLHTSIVMGFPFEKLEVYQRSLRFVTAIEYLMDQNKVSRSLGDQLSRAALSIPLNIAEGNGRWHRAEKRQFFWIARGSVFECVPMIEILKIKEIISEAQSDDFRDQLETLGKMLTRLIQAHET